MDERCKIDKTQLCRWPAELCRTKGSEKHLELSRSQHLRSEESIRFYTLYFNGPYSLMWCPDESIWYRILRFVTSRMWIWDQPRLHPSYQTGI